MPPKKRQNDFDVSELSPINKRLPRPRGTIKQHHVDMDISETLPAVRRQQYLDIPSTQPMAPSSTTPDIDWNQEHDVVDIEDEFDNGEDDTKVLPFDYVEPDLVDAVPRRKRTAGVCFAQNLRVCDTC